MVQLRALECFTYDNKTRNPGDIFEAASENDAHALTTIRKADLVSHDQVREPQGYADKIMKPEKEDDKKHNTRGRYMRRDMRAKE